MLWAADEGFMSTLKTQTAATTKHWKA